MILQYLKYELNKKKLFNSSQNEYTLPVEKHEQELNVTVSILIANVDNVAW